MNRTEHLLTCLIEECAEVQKEATKALRFGLNDDWHRDGTPAHKLEEEFSDLLSIYQMMCDAGFIKYIHTKDRQYKKSEKVLKWMEYAIEQGTLEEDSLK